MSVYDLHDQFDLTKHKWNTRRCVRFPRYRSRWAAEDAKRFAVRFSQVGYTITEAIRCPHCAAWHLLRKTLRCGETGASFLARLPPLFTPPNADPSRYYPNNHRR